MSPVKSQSMTSSLRSLSPWEYQIRNASEEVRHFVLRRFFGLILGAPRQTNGTALNSPGSHQSYAIIWLPPANSVAPGPGNVFNAASSSFIKAELEMLSECSREMHYLMMKDQTGWRAKQRAGGSEEFHHSNSWLM